MKRKRSLALSILGALVLLAGSARPAKAANCHCQYLANGTDVFTTQMDGFNQLKEKDRTRCENHCKGELDAKKVEMARRLGTCGNVTVRVFSWVGTWKPHKEVGSAEVNVPCGPGDAGDSSKKVNQYAAKFVCGSPGPGGAGDGVVVPGLYLTAINVHNPANKTVAFRKKFALALPDKEGPISSWFDARLGPDGAIEIDCPEIQERSGAGGFAKGFAVLETLGPEDQLDVVAVYTAGRGHVETLHTERVPARLVVPSPRCGELRLDLTSDRRWMVTAAPPEAHFPVPSPAAPVSTPIWGAGPPWISADLPNSQPPVLNSGANGASGPYVYDFTFCLCEGFSNPQMTLSVRADNRAQIFLNGNLVAPPVQGWTSATPVPASSFQAQWFKPGANTLRVRVHNDEVYTGMALTGTLTAHNGRCP